MGAIRTRLESYKQPKSSKAAHGRAFTPKSGPAKGSSAGIKTGDIKSAFWMARALQKDEEGARSSMALADASVARRQGALANGASIGQLLDQLNLEADNALASLPGE